MLELLICSQIRDGYKVVIPKAQKVNLISKYRKCLYTNPSQVKPNDKLKFIGWANATESERESWKHYL
jgi:hypothetical protein